MGKYFLGSVGRAEAFRKTDSGRGLELAFVAKTLTDSNLSISAQKDDIRSGQGGPIEFSFFHDASVEITLTDIEWKKEYIEEQLGVDFVATNQVYDNFLVKVNNGTVVEIDGAAGNLLPKRVQELPIKCAANVSTKIIWSTKVGEEKWTTENFTFQTEGVADKLIPAPGLLDGDYCVRFLAGGNYNAEVATVTSYILPEELFLIITTPLFSGDSCAASRGEVAGNVIFEVPRFQLNGQVDIQMNMSRNATLSISGSALASEAENCEQDGDTLIKIIQILPRTSWREDVKAIAVERDSVKSGDFAEVIAIMTDDTQRVLQTPYKDLIVYSNPSLTEELIDIISPANKWTPEAQNRVDSGNVFYLVFQGTKNIRTRVPQDILVNGQFVTGDGNIIQTIDRRHPVVVAEVGGES